MQCVHCKGITEDVTTDPFQCAHCGLHLFVRDHYSRRMAAFQGVRVDAEDPGNVPDPGGDVQMSAGTAKIEVHGHRCRPGQRSGHPVQIRAHATAGLLPTFSGGAHTVVEMHDDDTTRLNPYSLMSDPMDQTAYTISVRRDDDGRGGSLFMHNKVNNGDWRW